MSRAPLTSLLAVTLAAALAVGGCGSDQPESAPVEPAAASTPPQKPAHTATPTPAATSEPPAPSAAPRERGRHKVGALAPSTRPQARQAAEAHLLAAEEMPVLAGGWTAEAAAEDPTVGACHKTGLGTIGALESVQRTYTADGATATQVVARFADTRSAWRAQEVLEAWREDCAERLGNPNLSVSPLEEVLVPVGTGASYRAAFRKRASGLGILRTGSYLTVVEITADGGRYPANWEPARVAVRRIARTF